MKPLTLVEKILSRKAKKILSAGDFAVVRVDGLMIHDSNAPSVIDVFPQFNREKVMKGPDVVMVMDHFAPSNTEVAANIHKKMRTFIANQNITLYGEGKGIGHQLMCEQGHVFPGEIVVGTDSHSCTYGALNAFGTGIGATEAAGILAFNKMWFKVPETIKIKCHGSLPKGVTAKDIALKIIQRIGLRNAIYGALEFSGELISQLSIDERLTICNMGIEVGAKLAIMPADKKLLDWISIRPYQRTFVPVEADSGASYLKVIDLNSQILEPLIACPPMVNKVVGVSAVKDKKIDQVVLGSCTNGRVSDFKLAAQILEGNQVAKDIRLILLPASQRVLEELMENGTMQTLIKAGGILVTPGCGPCGGYHGGLVGTKEVVLSTTNRNFTGRMGSQDSEIYLCSPLTAAASALTGMITDPREVLDH